MVSIRESGTFSVYSKIKKGTGSPSISIKTDSISLKSSKLILLSLRTTCPRTPCDFVIVPINIQSERSIIRDITQKEQLIILFFLFTFFSRRIFSFFFFGGDTFRRFIHFIFFYFFFCFVCLCCFIFSCFGFRGFSFYFFL
ncbi:hypothetical protein ES705_49422 [subsurface metagenome]